MKISRIMSRRDMLRLSRSVSLGCCSLGLSVTACHKEVLEGNLLPFGLDDRPIIEGLTEAYSTLPFEAMEKAREGSYLTCKHLLNDIRDEQADVFGQISLALTILELGPLLSSNFGRFSELEPKMQSRFIEQWLIEGGFRSEIAYGIRPIFLFSLYEQPEIKRYLGMDQSTLSKSHSDQKGGHNESY